MVFKVYQLFSRALSYPTPIAMSDNAEAYSAADISSTPEASTQPLSKKAQKRAAKAAWLAEQKKERRAREKEKRKEKKRLRTEQDVAEADGDEGGRLKKKAKTSEHKVPKKPFHARIVVDLGFDDMMTENEIKSLTSQLAYTYSANRKAVNPFSSVLFTSLNGRTHTRLESISDAAYKRWIDTEWWTESYEKLWQTPTSSEPAPEQVNIPEDGATGKGQVNRELPAKDAKLPLPASKDSVVYLTADSTDELNELQEGETYIIGGLCDHNRYKNLCLKKAQTSGIRTARLPIGTYLSELKTRKVLTVNQTFEILLKWVETRDWKKALYDVVPKRKFEDKSGGSAKDAGSEKQGTAEAEESREGAIEEEDVKQVVVDATTLEEDDGTIPEDEATGRVVIIPKPANSKSDVQPTTMDTDEVPP
ncbi:hypothetical protein K474DRAFT_1633812 [Panus rudis PR-1116 ss-1]|nr:hypothetical protein K474DRAFT_1633812 [Panus rudis PR-1116 ss-1]